MIVDDDPLNPRLVRVLLAAEGYKVRMAPDAHEAIAVLKRFASDLILMEIQVPGIDGVQLPAAS